MFKKITTLVFISIFGFAAIGFAQTGTFSGTVTDEGGDPIEGASISLCSFGNWYNTETIEDGSFIIEDVEVGEYSATAFAWGFMMGFEDVEILEGETTIVDFVLEDWGWGGGGGATGTCSGTVTDEAGLPIEGASVTLQSNSGWGWGWGWNSYTTYTLEDGSFLIEDVEVGEYSASVFEWGYMWASEDIEILEDETTVVDFVLEEWGGGGGGATGICTGTVTDEAGLPIEGASITLHSNSGWGWGWGWNSYSTFTLEDGTFIIEDVEVGEYSASAFAWGYVWDSADIEILEDQTTVVDFVLEEWGGGGGGATGTCSGTVTDSAGTAVEGAFVSLHSDCGWGWGWGWGGNWYFTETEEDGSFLIEDVEVGEYTATASSWEIGWATEEIEILEDQTTVVDFVLEEWGWGSWDGFEIVELHGNILIEQMGSTGFYYLDINGDNQADYSVNFGPDWYNPPSGAERPENGEYVELIGCLLEFGAPATVIVYERDELFWRAPVETSPGLLKKIRDRNRPISDQSSVVSPVSGITNYPNPFNPETTIFFTLNDMAEMDIAVYNSLGQKVAQLIQGDMPAGNHQVRWNANNNSSGFYFLKIRAQQHTITKKILLTK